MDTQNPSAPTRSGGVVHDNSRHTDRFTMVGNHLAQHSSLTLLAIGLGVYIQSLPTGSPVDIKTLAKRFPEGAARIAAALRELEAHGYLCRKRERLPSGHLVTRTTFCNQPGRQQKRPQKQARPRKQAQAQHPPQAPPQPPPQAPEQPREHSSEAPARPKKPKKAKPLPPVPQPVSRVPGLLQAATELLAGLRRHDYRLILSECDTAHLAPGVAAWLERDVGVSEARYALTSNLPPEGPARPAAFLAYRLTAQLPPFPPPRRPAADPPPEWWPMQDCEGCDKGFRGPEPGRCRGCQTGNTNA